MNFQYTLHIRQSPDLSGPHFALSVPEKYGIVQALIYNLSCAFGKSEEGADIGKHMRSTEQVQLQVMECIDSVLAGGLASEMYIRDHCMSSEYWLEIFKKDSGQNDEYWTQFYTMRVITEGNEKLFFITARNDRSRYTPCTIYAKDLKEILQLWIDAPKIYIANPKNYKEELKKRTDTVEETMVVLESVEKPGDVLLRVSSRIGDDLWRIEFGPWETYGIPYPALQSQLTKEEILMDTNDLRHMAKEIKKAVATKKRVDLSDQALSLTFRQNEPNLNISLYYDTTGYPLFDLVMPETMILRPSVKVNYINWPYGKDDEESMFASDGMSGSSLFELPPQKLEKFANDLEKLAST